MVGKLARYQDHWSTRHTAVLWFTTSQRKANLLLEAIRGDTYRDCYLVGLIEDSASFLTAPIWRWGDAERLSEVVSWM